MQRIESVVVKILSPTKNKLFWLDSMEQAFSDAVQFCLDGAQELHTSNRTKIHKHCYYSIRRNFGLPSDYARMAIGAAVSLARSYYSLLKTQKHTSFPRISKSQGIGLGIYSYKLTENLSRWNLRCSTGKNGNYIWLPLCVPDKWEDRMQHIRGDAKLFKRNGNWYAMFPLHIDYDTPPVCDDEHTFIGIDLGIVRIATVSTPDAVKFFDGKEIRHRREHFADIRKRYQRKNRMDKIKAMRGKERNWMRDINHKISRQIVDLAITYERPVIVFEKLDGISSRVRGSKKFNRMMTSWAFRQLTDFVKYKAERVGITVVFVDPRGTSKTCSRCGHSSRSNRPDQSHFRCVACGYQLNADLNAARNIAALGSYALPQESPDTDLSNG